MSENRSAGREDGREGEERGEEGRWGRAAPGKGMGGKGVG